MGDGRGGRGRKVVWGVGEEGGEGGRACNAKALPFFLQQLKVTITA